MKRKIKFLLTLLLFTVILLCPISAIADENTDYQNQIENFDLSSFDLLDNDTKNLLEELGIDDFNYENLSDISLDEII